MKVKQLKELLKCVNEDAEVNLQICHDAPNVRFTDGDCEVYAPLVGIVTSYDRILLLNTRT